MKPLQTGLDPWADLCGLKKEKAHGLMNLRPIRPINQGLLSCSADCRGLYFDPSSQAGRRHHHHHGRRRRRRSRLVVASASPSPIHLQRHLRFLPEADAPRHHPRPLRPLPAVAGAGGQPQVPQREGGRGRRGRGRGGAPAAVQLAGVPRGRHGGDQAAAEARGRSGQAQAQGAIGGAEVPPEVRS